MVVAFLISSWTNSASTVLKKKKMYKWCTSVGRTGEETLTIKSRDGFEV